MTDFSISQVNSPTSYSLGSAGSNNMQSTAGEAMLPDDSIEVPELPNDLIKWNRTLL